MIGAIFIEIIGIQNLYAWENNNLSKRAVSQYIILFQLTAFWFEGFLFRHAYMSWGLALGTHSLATGS